jgi:hypothetical protein
MNRRNLPRCFSYEQSDIPGGVDDRAVAHDARCGPAAAPAAGWRRLLHNAWWSH